MKKLILLAILSLIIIVPFYVKIYAQQTTPSQRPRFFSEEFLDLQRILRDLPELEKDKKLALTKDQAKKLIEVLQDLIKRDTLPPKDAEKFVERIEKILNNSQLTYLDKLEIERQKRLEEQRRKWQEAQAQGRTSSQNFPRPQNQQQGQRQVDPEMTKVIEAWQKGKYLNPYYHVPSWKKILNDLISQLKKK